MRGLPKVHIASKTSLEQLPGPGVPIRIYWFYVPNYTGALYLLSLLREKKMNNPNDQRLPQSTWTRSMYYRYSLDPRSTRYGIASLEVENWLKGIVGKVSM